MTTKIGKCIVVEGLEGAGKTTAIEFIGSLLKKAGYEFITTQEPGTTPVGKQIREILKDPKNDLLPKTELLLITANRVELVEKVIKPALNNNQWVLGDRHFLSTLAYQGGGRGLDRDLILHLHKESISGFKPDLYLYLDLDPAIGLQRAHNRGKLDRFEQEGVMFFERVHKVFLEAAALYENVEVINAAQELPTVQNAIKQALFRHYPQLCKE